MGFDDLIVAINQLRSMVSDQGIQSGQIPHALRSLEELVRAQAQGHDARLEERITITITSGIDQGVTRMVREIDVANHTLAQNIENKTSLELRGVFNEVQLLKDVLINAGLGKTSPVVLENIEMTPGAVAKLEQELTGLLRGWLDSGYPMMAIKQGLEQVEFVDAAGKVFRPAFEWIFDESGPMARVALEEASGSPNFHPAMAALFGPSGSMADAATDAARGTDLEQASETLEQKIEQGVTGAMNEAGNKASAGIGAGVTSLGNAMTAIPQLYDSVTKLGTAWDKPNKSTGDYMALMSSMGGVLTQGVQTVEALAGVTKLASAAQAIFNAIMAMNPVVLVVIAVVALIAAVVLLIVYWDQVKAAIRDNPWIGVIVAMTGIIGLVVLIIAYWDEIKLAALEAANFISIQIQKVGQFFVGLWTLASMVWGAIVATAVNAGIAVVNAFITVGTEVQNFFIGVINAILSAYNAVADSVIGDVLGLEKAALIPEVDVQTRLIPPQEVPQIDVEAAFRAGPVTGGLEGAIADQQGVLAQNAREDAERRAAQAAPPPGAGAPAAPPAPPALPGPAPVGAPGMIGPPALPAAAGLAPAGVPGPGVAGAGGGQTVNLGGITVTINADRLEANAAQMLSDEIVAQLQARLAVLFSEQSFRTGTR